MEAWSPCTRGDRGLEKEVPIKDTPGILGHQPSQTIVGECSLAPGPQLHPGIGESSLTCLCSKQELPPMGDH